MYSKRREKIGNILKLFDTRKEIYQKEINELIGDSPRNAIRQIQHLEKDGLIKARVERKLGKKGPGKNIWSLTFKGVWVELTTSEGNSEIEAIISTYSDLLLTFKKWPLFKELGIADHFINLIRTGLWRVEARSYLLNKYGFDGKISFKNEKEWQDSTDSLILMPMARCLSIKPYSYDVEAFLRICRQDEELRKFIDQQLKKELFEEEKLYRELQEAKESWDIAIGGDKH